MNYEKKYLKYKFKYLQLKESIGGTPRGKTNAYLEKEAAKRTAAAERAAAAEAEAKAYAINSMIDKLNVWNNNYTKFKNKDKKVTQDILDDGSNIIDDELKDNSSYFKDTSLLYSDKNIVELKKAYTKYVNNFVKIYPENLLVRLGTIIPDPSEIIEDPNEKDTYKKLVVADTAREIAVQEAKAIQLKADAKKKEERKRERMR